jgi:hypothetical protein
VRLESAREFKQEVAVEAFAARVEGLLDAAAPAEPIVSVALGVAPGTSDDDFRVAIRVPPGHEAVAEELRERVHGEADVRVLTVEARPAIPEPQAGAPPWLNEPRRPLEPGAAISLRGYGWVGTLFGFGRRKNGALVGISNAHVLGGVDRVPVGTAVLQPFGGEAVGVTAEHAPLKASGNMFDLQLFDLRRVPIVKSYNHAAGAIGRLVDVSPDDLGRTALKIGRTTGVRQGRCTAFEVDNLPVGYGAAGTLRFDNQVEFTGTPDDFSAGGDSGSMICWIGGDVPAILFAGGRSSGGQDFTYGCPALAGLRSLGIALE